MYLWKLVKTIFVRLLSLLVFKIKDLSSDSKGRESEYEMRQRKQKWAVAKDRLKPHEFLLYLTIVVHLSGRSRGVF